MNPTVPAEPSSVGAGDGPGPVEDAGYERAIEVADERGVHIPMRE